MKRIRITRLLLGWHRWLGLVTGLFLLVIGLSGSALVFSEEIDRVLFPHLHSVEPRGRRVSLDSMYEKVRSAFPEAWGLRFPRLHLEDPARSIQMSLMLPGSTGGEWCYLYLNPYDGTILGIQGADTQRGFRDNPVDWFLWLHFSLLGGKPGQLAVGIIALLFIGSLLTGAIIYRKKLIPALCCHVPIRFRNFRTAASSIHHVIGVWALLLNLILAVTGFWMMRYVFHPGFYVSEQPNRAPAPALTFSIDAMLATIRQEVPTFVPHWISALPRDGGRIALGGAVKGQPLLFSPDSEVVFDPQRGEIIGSDLLADRSWSKKLSAAVAPLHFGSFGGWPVKLLYVVAGLTPPLLSVTGFCLYYSRTWNQRKRMNNRAS